MAKVLREIRRALTSWDEIHNPPLWVKKATDKYYNRFGKARPYDHVIYFKGKTWLYKVWAVMIMKVTGKNSTDP